VRDAPHGGHRGAPARERLNVINAINAREPDMPTFPLGADMTKIAVWMYSILHQKR